MPQDSFFASNLEWEAYVLGGVSGCWRQVSVHGSFGYINAHLGPAVLGAGGSWAGAGGGPTETR